MIHRMDRRVIIAATAFSAAALVFAAVLAGALRTEPLPDLSDTATTEAAADAALPDVASAEPITAVDPPLVETLAPETPVAERQLTSDALALAADQDPFQPDRRRPQPYMLPGEAVEVRAPAPRPELPPPPDFRVLGTIVTASGGAALVQVENEPPRIVNRGEALQGYRLDRIELDAATLVNRDRSLRLAVTTPEPREENARGRRGNNNNNRGNRGNNNNNNNARGRANTAAQRALEQRAQQLQQMGVPPEMIERLMQQAGRGGDAVFSFSTDGGMVRVRGGTFEMEAVEVPVVEGRVGGVTVIRRDGRGGGQ